MRSVFLMFSIVDLQCFGYDLNSPDGELVIAIFIYPADSITIVYIDVEYEIPKKPTYFTLYWKMIDNVV